MKHRTEQVYDDLMAPLVAELIGIALREGIPLFLDAGMINPDGNEIHATTHIHGALVPGVMEAHTICRAAVFGGARASQAVTIKPREIPET